MLPKKSILIVDDDIAHRTMLRILLDWNYEIFEATILSTW
jgi:PleD family two-component response regulator